MTRTDRMKLAFRFCKRQLFDELSERFETVDFENAVVWYFQSVASVFQVHIHTSFSVQDKFESAVERSTSRYN